MKVNTCSYASSCLHDGKFKNILLKVIASFWKVKRLFCVFKLKYEWNFTRTSQLHYGIYQSTTGFIIGKGVRRLLILDSTSGNFINKDLRLLPSGNYTIFGWVICRVFHPSASLRVKYSANYSPSDCVFLPSGIMPRAIIYSMRTWFSSVRR